VELAKGNWLNLHFLGPKNLQSVRNTMKRHAVFADENTLRQFNCSRSQNSVSAEVSDACELDILNHNESGWCFKSCHSNILNEKASHDLTCRIRKYLSLNYSSIIEDGESSSNLVVNGFKLHTPPMLFGNDTLQLIFSDVEISIVPNHSMFCWAEKVYKCLGLFIA